MNTTTTIPNRLNRTDRERFAALSPWEQEIVGSTVARLYDGTRTVAQCWKLALDALDAIED